MPTAVAALGPETAATAALNYIMPRRAAAGEWQQGVGAPMGPAHAGQVPPRMSPAAQAVAPPKAMSTLLQFYQSKGPITVPA